MSEPAAIPEHITLEPLPFEQAMAYWRELLPLTGSELRSVDAAVRARAFTISRVTVMEVLQDIHWAVEAAIADGETLAEFAGRLEEIMAVRGWKGLTPWHLETIFRNNIQTAYAVGRFDQMIARRQSFPYWQYDAVNDSATRPTHAALDGRVFPADHEIWDTWYPPNGHRCRCSVTPVHKYAAEEEGLAIETEDPTGTLIEPKDPVTGVTLPARQLIPDPGWETNPAKRPWQPDLDKYPDELRRQFERDAK